MLLYFSHRPTKNTRINWKRSNILGKQRVSIVQKRITSFIKKCIKIVKLCELFRIVFSLLTLILSVNLPFNKFNIDCFCWKIDLIASRHCLYELILLIGLWSILAHSFLQSRCRMIASSPQFMAGMRYFPGGMRFVFIKLSNLIYAISWTFIFFVRSAFFEYLSGSSRWSLTNHYSGCLGLFAKCRLLLLVSASVKTDNCAHCLTFARMNKNLLI